MPKAYLHYEGKHGPDHTFVWSFPAESERGMTGLDLGRALSGFTKSYNRKHGQAAYDGGKGMDPSLLQLIVEGDPSAVSRSRRRCITLDTLSDSPIDPELVHGGCDLKVEEGVPAATRQHPVAAVGRKEDKSSSQSEGSRVNVGGGARGGGVAASAIASAAAAGGAGESAGSKRDVSPAVSKLVAKAEKQVASKQLRAARDLLKKALKLDPRNGRALRCLTEVYTRAELSEEAFSTAKECCALASDSGPKDFLEAGRCLMKLGRHEEARTALARARCTGPGEIADDAEAALALCSVHLGDAPVAAGMYLQVLQRTNEKHVEALVGYGRLAMMVKQVEKGVPSLLKAVVVQQEHKLARESLATALGTSEGMKTLKEQVEASPETSSVYHFLGTITKEHGHIDASVELHEVALSINPSDASAALAVMHGHEIRGDLDQAIMAAKAFLSGDPQRGVGARGARNSDILQILEDITPSSSSSSSSSLSSSSSSPSTATSTTTTEDPTPVAGPTKRLAVHWATIEDPCSSSSSSSTSTTTSLPSSSSGKDSADDELTFAWCTPISTCAGARAGAEGVSTMEEEQGHAESLYKGWVGASGGGGDGVAWRGTPKKKEVYKPEDLNLLALYFTVMKVLYLMGKLSVLPPLLQVLEPTRMRSTLPLHFTPIRNEQAYYCCIAQLLSCVDGINAVPPMVSPTELSAESSCGKTVVDRNEDATAITAVAVAAAAAAVAAPAAPAATILVGGETSKGGGSAGQDSGGGAGEGVMVREAMEEAVYVCGDSHTLTPAWREVTVGGRRRVLKPALVTGLKHWHLRPESEFYPKKNFERVLEKIPDGSAVVFIFGEIDCREGILLAVEKLRYETVEEGMMNTISIFVKVAEAVARERGFQVFIHPVIPVLDETRSMVTAYNRVFRRVVNKSKVLRWLDFFDDLLDETGKKLLPEFRLDGTHLAPGYLRLLERALSDTYVDRTS